jgi:murein endopeptidase
MPYFKFSNASFLAVMIFFAACAKHVNLDNPSASSENLIETEQQKNVFEKAIEILSAPIHVTYPEDLELRRGEVAIKSTDGQYTVLKHSFAISKDSAADFDPQEKSIHFRGSANFDGFKGYSSYKFDLQGSVVKRHGVLFPVEKVADGEPKIMAIVVCTALHFAESEDPNQDVSTPPTCDSFFIDLYIRFDNHREFIFNRQVEECGVADNCLTIFGDSSGTVSEVKPPTIAAPKDQAPENRQAPKKPDPKEATPAPVTRPTVDMTMPDPEDVEGESEGEDRSQKRGEYIGANREDKISVLAGILDTVGTMQTKIDPFEQIGFTAPAPEIKLRPETISKKPPAIGKVENPKKNSPPSEQAPKNPPLAPTKDVLPNKTEVPEKEDPSLKDKEFPFNVAFPLKGPLQVYGGHNSGRLVNATELTEPGPNEEKTFAIDADTKNPRMKKTFGTFYAVEFIKKFAAFAYPVLRTTLRVNDLSLRNGGGMRVRLRSGKIKELHAWHRVGLDADIEYHDIKGNTFSTEQKWFMFKNIAASPLVNEILMESYDRDAICSLIKKTKQLDEKTKVAMQKMHLGRVGDHKTHFHINFNCTYNDTCEQNELDELPSVNEKSTAACMSIIQRK